MSAEGSIASRLTLSVLLTAWPLPRYNTIVVADSFAGGVDPRRAGRGEIRARVAIQGSNVEALTGAETFRIPVARCSLSRDGEKIVVRDEQGSLVIWSDDDGFLDALERAQRGTLKEQVESLRGAQRRRRALKRFGKALIALAVLYVASVPVARWALRGGVPAATDRIGASALKHLDLPTGVAPIVERRLGILEEQIRPACAPATRSFRVLLADYADVHSFGVPPDVVVVTAGLVCGAEDADLVMEAVARELAHLENHDVHQRVAEAVDWHTPLELVQGDTTRLRERLLDFADPKLSPGFTDAQEKAADERATAMLKRAGVPLASSQDLAAVKAQLQQLQANTDRAAQPPAGGGDALDWSKVRAEACTVIGR